MGETKTKSRGAAPGQGPAVEVKAALQGFLTEFNTFQSELKTKLYEQENRINMLDRKSIATSRPALSTTAEVELPHKKAFSTIAEYLTIYLFCIVAPFFWE